MTSNIKIINENEFLSDDKEFTVKCILFKEILTNSISEETEIYGIELQKLSSDNYLIEKEIVNGITSNINFALYVFNVLSENKVTPICLCGVIDDLIGQSESNAQ